MIKKSFFTVSILLFSLKLFAQQCLYTEFENIKWINVRLSKLIKSNNNYILNYKWIESKKNTEKRFSRCELKVKGGVNVVYEIKGCNPVFEILTLIYATSAISDSILIRDLHNTYRLFWGGISTEKIFSINEDFFKKNKKEFEDGKIVEIDTTPYEGFETHKTTFQKIDGKIKVELFTKLIYIIH